MRNLTGWVAASLVAATAIAPVGAAPVAAPTRPQPVAGAAAYSAAPAATGRLKFKSAGPVCMCGEGMSERDIEQALARSAAGNIAGRDTGGGHAPAGGQEKNFNLGVAK